MIGTKKVLLLSLGTAALAALALAAQSGVTLKINGAVASADVRTINGKAYVPVADVAKALGMAVAKSGNGYALARAGGANELKGYTGKQGDVVFTGKWRFTVLGWKRADAYQATMMKRRSWDDQYQAKSDEDLIVVACRIKNGTPKKDELVFPTTNGWEGTNDALTDDAEHAYAPVGFDVAETEGAPPGTIFLPGSAIDFKMVFRVPKGTTPKDVVFTALRYDSRAGYNQKSDPPQDIRVTLGPEG